MCGNVLENIQGCEKKNGSLTEGESQENKLWGAGGFNFGQKKAISYTKRIVADENFSLCRSVMSKQVLCVQDLQQPVDGEQQ